MTDAQFKLVCKLAGGLNEAGAKAYEAGLLTRVGSNKRDRTNALMGIATAEASKLIEQLGGRKLTEAPAPRHADNLVSEGEERDGHMTDRGEDN